MQSLDVDERTVPLLDLEPSMLTKVEPVDAVLVEIVRRQSSVSPDVVLVTDDSRLLRLCHQQMIGAKLLYDSLQEFLDAQA